MHFNKHMLEMLARKDSKFSKGTLEELLSTTSVLENASAALKEDSNDPALQSRLGHILHNYNKNNYGVSEFDPESYVNEPNKTKVRKDFVEKDGAGKKCADDYRKAFNHYFKEHVREIVEGVDEHNLVELVSILDKEVKEWTSILQNDQTEKMRSKLYKIYHQYVKGMDKDTLRARFEYALDAKKLTFKFKGNFTELKDDKYKLSKRKIANYIIDNYDKIQKTGLKENLAYLYLEEHKEKKK